MKNSNLYFALAGSALISALFVSVNLLFSPGFLWVVFACPPIIWWPLSVHLGRRAATFKFAITSFLAAMVYYGLLNLLFFPGHLWILYIAFALSWWPVTMFFADRKQPFGYSLICTGIATAFFMAVNFITTPHLIWFVFPVFAILWWPLSVYFFVFKKLSGKKTTGATSEREIAE